MNIPFMDLKSQYQSLKTEIDAAMAEVISKVQFVGGEIKENFERNFAKVIGAKHCIGMGNGTDAIYIALMAMGLEKNDEVLVPANSFIASSEAVTIAGGKPVFVDVDAKTFHMDWNKVEELLEKRSHTKGGKIKFIAPVHLYGRICDMPRVMSLAKKYDLRILEDTAQAHLANINGQNAGTWGEVGTFSFYPGKNLGAYGDAGCAVTNDDKLAEKIKKIANHGRVKKYDHDMEGFNSRLDTLQAAILNVKLKHLQKWSDTRYEKALIYDELLKNNSFEIVKPEIPKKGEHVFHLYVTRLKNREAVQNYLTKSGVQTVIHYPIALPNLAAYKHLNHTPKDFPVASQTQEEILSLPLYPEITREQQKYVVDKLFEAYKSL